MLPNGRTGGHTDKRTTKMDMFVLRALDKEGNTYFYSGKTGMDWLTHYPSEAFTYSWIEIATLKAKNFNKMEPVHGYWFIPQRVRIEA